MAAARAIDLDDITGFEEDGTQCHVIDVYS